MTDVAEALKRSARRRLIGAVALALVTVVALPMLFDKEPPPLAGIDIVIPSRDTPGTAVLLEGSADAGAGSAAPSTPASTSAPTPAPTPSPTLGSPAASPPVSAAPTPRAATPAPVPVQKPASLPAPAATASTAAKMDLPKGPSVASNGYFLQLGVFSAEAGARTLAKRVAEAGFTVHVVEDAGRYKVRCGPLSAKPAAQDLQTQLRGKGFTAVLVSP